MAARRAMNLGWGVEVWSLEVGVRSAGFGGWGLQLRVGDLVSRVREIRGWGLGFGI